MSAQLRNYFPFNKEGDLMNIQGVYCMLFGAFDNIPGIDMMFTVKRLDFNSMRKAYRGKRTIAFTHKVGGYELTIYSSCIPEYRVMRKGKWVPLYAMSTAGFNFDYKGYNYEFADVGAVFVTLTNNGKQVFCKSLSYSGNIMDRLAIHNEHVASVTNSFNKLITESLHVATPLFKKEQKKLDKNVELIQSKMLDHRPAKIA